MTKEEKEDPFLWRTQGMKFDVGDNEEDSMSAMVAMDNRLLCVMRKSIHAIALADTIDPERTNPSIPNSQQKIISYGSDEPAVGRTFLQADVLFQEQAQPNNTDRIKALNIALSFLKEIISLKETATSYIKDEQAKNSAFTGNTGEDQSLHLPSISAIDQLVKHFLINVDHATAHLMTLSQLFYPDIIKKKWSVQLIEKVKQEKGEDNPALGFFESMSDWVWLMRNLRNAVEHPGPDDKVEIQNYILSPEGKVLPPTLLYKNTETPLSKKLISVFMNETIDGIQLCFELLMAHLCNMRAVPFANIPRSVVEVPFNTRLPHQAHIRFGYHIPFTD